VFARRFAGLVFLSMCIYDVGSRWASDWYTFSNRGFSNGMYDVLTSGYWQGLTQIAFSTLFCLPVIEKSITVRVIYMLFTLPLMPAIYLVVYQNTGSMLAQVPILGASGGCLAWMGGWSFIMLTGSIIHDLIVMSDKDSVQYSIFSWPGLRGEETLLERKKLTIMITLSFLFMAVGYFLTTLGGFVNFGICAQQSLPSNGMMSVETYPATCDGFMFPSPPFANANAPITLWTMTAAFPTAPFLFFTTGFSMLIYLICYYLWDVLSLPTFAILTTFGTNSLATYILTFIIRNGPSRFMVPIDAPSLYVAFFGLPVFFLCVYCFVRFLELHRIYFVL